MKLKEKTFNISQKSYGFAKIISSLHTQVDIPDPNVTLEINFKQPESCDYAISEEYLRWTIKKNFLPKLKNYC